MPYNSIYQNSYVIFVATFIIISIFFYLFEIGYNIEINNNNVVKRFSWKYPLAIALIVWLFWHFYLYPPPENIRSNDLITSVTSSDQPIAIRKTNLATQKITLANWN